MTKQVLWTKIILEEFVKVAALTEDEEMILRTHVAGWSRTKQAHEFNLSVSTVDRIIKRLKIKYDHAEKYCPLLPPRKIKAEDVFRDFKKKKP